MSSPIHIYTDGSASVKDKTGAWSFVAVSGDSVHESAEYEAGTTVNRMELSAILNALRFVPTKGSRLVRVYSDSEVSVNTINVHFPRAMNDPQIGLKNTDLLLAVYLRLTELRDNGRPVTVLWMKGHQKNRFNDRADKLAGLKRRELVAIQKQNEINLVPESETLRVRKVPKRGKSRGRDAKPARRVH